MEYDDNWDDYDDELDELSLEEFMEIPFNKASVYIFGCLQHLQSLDLIKLGRDKITPKGIGLFDQLKATGYRPTMEECVGILLSYEVFHRKDFMTGLNVLLHLINLGNDEFEEFVEKHEKDKADGNPDIFEEPESEYDGDVDYY